INARRSAYGSFGGRSGAPSGLRPSSFVMCNTPVEVQLPQPGVSIIRAAPQFVLGAEPVRPVDLAAFFATIANEGLRPAPHVIDSVERDGTVVYRHNSALATRISSV